MKVKELIIKLSDYNPEAELSVIACNKSHRFSITYGRLEGDTKETTDTVDFYVDELNVSEGTE